MRRFITGSKASGPTFEVSEDVAGLLDAYARRHSLPLDEAANEILARFLYQGDVVH